MNKLVYIGLVAFSVQNAIAQTNDELHQKCREAKDYIGCVTYNTEIQEKPLVEKSVTNTNNKSVTFVGYTMDEIKSGFIPKFQGRNPTAQVVDNGYTLTFTQYSIQGSSVRASLYTALLGNSYSKLDAISMYTFVQQDPNTIVVTPQAFLRLTNAFGQPETHPENSAVKDMVAQMYKDFQ